MPKTCQNCSALFTNRKRSSYCCTECCFQHRQAKHPNGKCLVWTGPLDHKGYGQMAGAPGGKAHRYAYERAYGVKLSPREHVCHECDIRHCVEPTHLHAGSGIENMHDMYSKGRGRKAHGESNGNAVLTEDIVRQIMVSAETNRELANRLGVKYGRVQEVRTGRAWNHVTGLPCIRPKKTYVSPFDQIRPSVGAEPGMVVDACAFTPMPVSSLPPTNRAAGCTSVLVVG